MDLKSILTMLLGLVALSGLSLFCINHHNPIIETDLEKRTATALAFEGMEWSHVSMDGQVATLNGSAPSQALRQKAGEIALSVWGVDAVMNRLVVTERPEMATAIQPAPKNEVIKPSIPTPNPYEFKLKFDGKTAILSGYIPDKETRAEIRDATRKYLGGDSVITRLKIAPGAPEKFIYTINHGLIPYLKDFSQVTATLQNNDLNITGSMPSGEMREALQQTMRKAVPSQIAMVFDIETLPEERSAESLAEQKTITTERCQQKFNNLLGDQSIRFITGKTIIDPSSYVLLDTLVLTAKTCPETKIEIAGHTDNNGNSDRNQTLSQGRADAVLNYLVSKGINIERLTSKGYGETRPIATNTTPEGQTKNRRIEFITREQ